VHVGLGRKAATIPKQSAPPKSGQVAKAHGQKGASLHYQGASTGRSREKKKERFDLGDLVERGSF